MKSAITTRSRLAVFAMASALVLSACGSSEDETPVVVEAEPSDDITEEATSEAAEAEEDAEEVSADLPEVDLTDDLDFSFGPKWPREGECLIDAEVEAAVSDEQLSEMPTVDCSEEHDSQVFRVFDLPDGPFPSDDEYSAALEDECLPAFEDFVGVAYEDSELFIYDVGPLEEGWEMGDREVICVAYFDDGQMTNETFEGSNL